MRYSISLVCLFCLLTVACKENTSGHKAKKKATSDKADQRTKGTVVDTGKAVVIFKQNMEDEVTDNDFVVKVYPSLQADHFRVVIHYGGNEASDEIAMLPKEYYKKIELRKGKTDQECVFGFIDTKGKFNEMKLISASGTSIGIKTLKAYYLTTK